MARRKRILYYYHTLNFDTGSPKVLTAMVELLDRDRFEPAFLAASEGDLVAELRARDVEIIPGDVTSVSPRFPWRSARHLLAQRSFLRRWDIDVVHVNEFGWNYDLVLAAGLARIPVILHVHNPLQIHRQNLNRLAAHRFLTVSQAQVETVEGFDYVRDRHAVLYNSVDVERFAGGTSIRHDLGVEPEAFVVGTVAQIREAKGLMELVEVARRLVPRHPHLQFLVIGPTPKDEEVFAARLREAATDTDIRGRVRFLGSRSDVPDLLASMDAFVLPTWDETFGVAVIEAMAAGLPVVASRVGGVPEIIASPDAGTLVTPKDVDGFTDAVHQLVADPARARAMGRTAAASVHGRFDPATIGRQLNAIYDAVLTGR